MVLNVVLTETPTGAGRNLSHGTAVCRLKLTEASDRGEIVRSTATSPSTRGQAPVRRHDQRSLLEGLVVGHNRQGGLPRRCSVDDEFDEVERATRLATADGRRTVQAVSGRPDDPSTTA